MDKNVIQAAFEKHGSDKANHGYAEFYAQHLPKNPKRILEIGVKEGASVRAWRELFPGTEIHGLDLFDEYPMPEYTTDNIFLHKGNQCDWELLERIRDLDFDVIIDDGSHNSRDQLITFFGLMSEGCTYFIEDLHCQRDEFYSQGLPINFMADVLFSNYEGYAVYSDDLKIVRIC